jgi:RNA 2',3'-cyclic 3'-phosphodiesterase
VLASGGLPVPLGNFHITLAFIGSVLEADIGRLESAAGEVAHRVPRNPMQITLDVMEYWRKPKVLCVTTGASAGADMPGGALADILRARCVAAGFAPDLMPFRAHVTLARQVHHLPRLMTLESVTWSFTEFVLVDSETHPEGPVYTVLERFPFGR